MATVCTLAVAAFCFCGPLLNAPGLTGRSSAPLCSMSAHSPADRSAPLEIQPDRWNAFLSEFTRANRGAHARLQVLDPNTEMGRLVPIENWLFDGVSIDLKDRERTIML